MSDHSHYEELAALAAGGHLSDEELTDLQRHAETCAAMQKRRGGIPAKLSILACRWRRVPSAGAST